VTTAASINPHTFIIAEAGVNHNGSVRLAKKMIDQACVAGVDAIKFQSFKTEQLVNKNAPKAEYQLRHSKQGESQFQMLKKLELSEDEQQQLFDYCLQKKIQFLSSPFDVQSAAFLIHKLKCPLLKLGSGELTNSQLLYYITQHQVKLILSTGMSDIEEIKTALSVLAFGYSNNNQQTPSREKFKRALLSAQGIQALKKQVSLLHCTTEYPCPIDEVNLNVIKTLQDEFPLAIGYSDHTQGHHISLAAVAIGASIIEKHFTLDKKMNGPDHASSIEVNELTSMVQQIRDIDRAKGQSIKATTASELKNLKIARKGLYAKIAIAQGEVFSDKNLTVKRPEALVPASDYWDKLGQIANKNYHPDEPIQP